MANEKELAKIAERLEAMSARNDELRLKIEARNEDKKALVERHAQTVGRLETQLANAKVVQAAELKAHDLETQAAKDRREELKADYGLLKPAFDGIIREKQE